MSMQLLNINTLLLKCDFSVKHLFYFDPNYFCGRLRSANLPLIRVTVCFFAPRGGR